MCLHYFKGKGYSGGFTEHMRQIKERLETTNPQICLVTETDEICSACPNNENGTCVSDCKVKSYDRAVLEMCGIGNEKNICYNDFAKAVCERILEKGLRTQICGDCQWDSLCND
jgi:hypothetical protein